MEHNFRNVGYNVFVCRASGESPMLMYVIYDSDGNPVAATARAEHLGTLIAEHFVLVDRTPGADEPFLTVRPEAMLSKRPLPGFRVEEHAS